MKIKKEVVNYLVFGVLTTLINIVSYGILSKIFNMDFKLATTIAWILSVIFAFITNKIYVFNSKNLNVLLITKEFISFIFFRLLSYIVDIGMMIILVEWMKMDDLVSKILVNVIVVIVNYFASRYFVFKTAE
ncbi:putative flippase GtrA [Neobacillus niacini]|uniref:GtrA family protein n=1 Tax=Neobacillus niacini TaxID=86668 RepID=UPI00285689E2|nr:GtrA family protein [Neobacillus niacini]MDR7078843.1 putative flippase GtrA [Neobacillus niacini]